MHTGWQKKQKQKKRQLDWKNLSRLRCLQQIRLIDFQGAALILRIKKKAFKER